MAVGWGITVSGVAQLQRALARTAAAASNFRAPLTMAVDKVARPSITENFEVAGRPPWEPLSDETIARKGGDRPLLDSGRGMDSATVRARWKIDRDQAEYRGDSFPQSTWYLQLHQQGADEWNADFPARPYAVTQPEDLAKMHGIFAAWLDAAVIPRFGRG